MNVKYTEKAIFSFIYQGKKVLVKKKGKKFPTYFVQSYVILPFNSLKTQNNTKNGGAKKQQKKTEENTHTTHKQKQREKKKREKRA